MTSWLHKFWAAGQLRKFMKFMMQKSRMVKKQAKFLRKTINTVAPNISINIKKRHRQNQEG